MEDKKLAAIAQKIKKGYHRTRGQKYDGSYKELIEPTPALLRKGSKKSARLEVNERLDIAFKAIIQQERMSDLACEYSVTQARIS